MAGDITTAAGRAAALAACPQVDILVNNAGGPPPGDFRDWDREAWIKALDANMLTPIELIKATVDAMAARGFGRVVNITSGAVKAPIDMLGLSNGARSGPDRLRRRAGAQQHRGARRDDQRPAARRVRHRPPAQRPCRRRAEDRPADGRVMARARAQTIPAQRFGTRRGVRRGLRLPVQRARRLPHRPEPAARRRRVPGHVLTTDERIDGSRHRRAAVPALLERASTSSRQPRQTQCRARRVPQLVQQRARALELVVVVHPDLGQRLVGRHLAGDAARVHALHRRAMPAWLSRSAHSVARARLGAVVRRFIGCDAGIAEFWHDSAPPLDNGDIA